jgi:hypothetical protein
MTTELHLSLSSMENSARTLSFASAVIFRTKAWDPSFASVSSISE